MPALCAGGDGGSSEVANSLCEAVVATVDQDRGV
eukprot:CAMPEP_0175297892 /NCGR_PEP_ID=MMETSP0093-20121207/59803_1 /TAXON_ID=311494 /ORGANISM="Alexandrium monilatum, Strain CCMP3105" /LENGTH=33 /DNA_ID= /DNA_START= /DNA_END= /DNA_ORIENTATION=